MELTAENVEKVFMDCLFRDDKDTSDPAIAEGITLKIGFNKERLSSHSDDVTTMLAQLPKEFQKDSGGGWSFLNACNNSEGEQWTGLHKIMEQLFTLGLASGKVISQLPRELWEALPGGMPYYVVL
ncbi:hypothetical protein LCGC14_1128560 [marine sediment metagenome]|uniref:Uncharacterized protein n=1 Tax=marine sediment metagenome TaxID=412755 RepID=A0A0F9M6K4_9ZZZZ